ncbi:MAG: metalloregulator ArsR/SmtB family transcription factor [Armatimonadota bacterium]|nr:metalloregulator ArsR/SmtB family transcription factor [Armatimonadota bacterium]
MKSRFAAEATILRALGHPARLAILEVLRHRPACVCHLTAALHRPQAYVSQQLGVLRDAGLIEGQRDGAFVYYYYRLRNYGVLGMLDLATRLLGRAPEATPAAGPLAGCECPQCAVGEAPAKGAGA